MSAAGPNGTVSAASAALAPPTRLVGPPPAPRPPEAPVAERGAGGAAPRSFANWLRETSAATPATCGPAKAAVAPRDDAAVRNADAAPLADDTAATAGDDARSEEARPAPRGRARAAAAAGRRDASLVRALAPRDGAGERDDTARAAADPAGADRFAAATDPLPLGFGPRTAFARADDRAHADADPRSGDATMPGSAGVDAGKRRAPGDADGAVGSREFASHGRGRGDPAGIAAAASAVDPATAGGAAVAAAGASTPIADARPVADRPAHATVPAPVGSPEFAASLGVRLSVLARDGVQHAELHLNPAEMGPLSIRIELDGAAARVDFAADHAATREAIEGGLPELASALRDAGFTLAGGGVSAGGGRGPGDGAAGDRSGDDSDKPSATDRPAAATALRRAVVRAGGVDTYV